MSEVGQTPDGSKTRDSLQDPEFRRSCSRKRKIPDKQFVDRNSVLTDLFEINHFCTIYNIFVVIFIILFLSTVAHDLVESGTTQLGINTVLYGFGKFHLVTLYWSGMLMSTFAAYFLALSWASYRISIHTYAFKCKLLDFGFFCAFAGHQVVFLLLPAIGVAKEGFPPASSMVILMEQIRMLMKMYAFVRTVAPRVMTHKVKDEDQKEPFPEFSKFLYFMFAPTIIYRDDYPRTSNIRWHVVMSRFVEVALVIFYVAFIFERLLIPSFSKFDSHPLDRRIFLQFFGTVTAPGTLLFLCGFYLLLHAWMNGWAEMLRFGDRKFYEDWWNCRSFDVYFRTWNIPVHDWLHTYVYKDVYENITNGSKSVSALAVFMLSAIVHEYIIALAFDFFYPVILVFFGFFGVLLFFVTQWISKYINSNIFFWFCIMFIFGVICALYTMEFFARMNCKPHDDQFIDYFLPRSWNCSPIVVPDQAA